MKAVSAYLTPGQQPKGLDRTPLASLWVSLAEMYGAKFTSQYGETPLQTWAIGLSGKSAADIGQGIEGLKERGSDWPPSLPEFVRLCETKQNKQAHKEWVSLPKPRDREKGRAAIRNILEGLNGR